MWTKEKVKRDIIKRIPQDIVIINWSYFHPQNLVISGYCQSNRKNLLKKIEKQFKSYKWHIKFNFISISGKIDRKLINPILDIIPQFQLNLIDINDVNNLISINLSKKPSTSILNSLQKFQREVRFGIYLEYPESIDKISLNSIIDQINKKEQYENKDITDIDFDKKILSILPSWIIQPKITIKEKKIIISVSNDIKDGERLNFLEILLESQIGRSIQIEQIFSFEDKLEYLSEIISNYLINFELKSNSNSNSIVLEYTDFPIPKELEIKIKNEAFKKTHLDIKKFVSKFLENIDFHCLDIKNWILSKFINLEYCFVYFSQPNRSFMALVPEENAIDVSLSKLQSQIDEQLPFDHKISVFWIEDKPDIYLRKRIFNDEQEKSKLKKIEFNEKDNSLKIFYSGVEKLSEKIWKKIILRLTRFHIEIIDPNTKLVFNIFDYSDYLNNLDQENISELIYKYIPEEALVKSIIYDQRQMKFVITIENLLLLKAMDELKTNLEIKLKILIQISSFKDINDYIRLLNSNLPNWIVNPKIEANKYYLKLIVQNDFEDELAIQDFIKQQCKKLLIPIRYEIQLSKFRIKQIILDIFGDMIHIQRLKIYQIKKSIYLEGNIKVNRDDEDFEAIIARIESKTKFSVEPYIKRNQIITQKNTVHDILEDLKNKYELKDFFPDNVLSESENLKEFEISDLEERIDLTDLACFSIDPFGTKIIDDCISIQKISQEDKDDEILIGIHITDLSLYFPKDSEIDKEAKRRGMIIYLPHEKKNIPIYPESVTKLASLTENAIRPSISLFIRLNLDLNIEEYFINKTIIKNKKQFTYHEVNEILLEQADQEYLNDFQLLVNITTQFRYNRIQRGSINLDSAQGNISDLLVTELMIMGNSLMALYFQTQISGQKIYRNQKIKSHTFQILQTKFQSYGYKLDLINKSPLTDINRIISESIINNDSEIIFQELRKFLSNAYYSHSCTGHESLGTKWYTQWTSPLRRYMDLVVQRLLNNEIFEDLPNLCQYQSAVERLIKLKLDTIQSNFFIKKFDTIETKSSFKLTLTGLNSKRIIFSTSESYLIVIMIENIDNSVLNKLKTLTINDSIHVEIKNVYKDKKDFFINFILDRTTIDGLNLNHLIKGKILFINDAK